MLWLAGPGACERWAGVGRAACRLRGGRHVQPVVSGRVAPSWMVQQTAPPPQSNPGILFCSAGAGVPLSWPDPSLHPSTAPSPRAQRLWHQPRLLHARPVPAGLRVLAAVAVPAGGWVLSYLTIRVKTCVWDARFRVPAGSARWALSGFTATGYHIRTTAPRKRLHTCWCSLGFPAGTRHLCCLRHPLPYLDRGPDGHRQLHMQDRRGCSCRRGAGLMMGLLCGAGCP